MTQEEIRRRKRHIDIMLETAARKKQDGEELLRNLQRNKCKHTNKVGTVDGDVCPDCGAGPIITTGEHPNS